MCPLVLNIWLRLKAAQETPESSWPFLLSSFITTNYLTEPRFDQSGCLKADSNRSCLKKSVEAETVEQGLKTLDWNPLMNYLALTALIQLSGNSVRGYMRPFNFRSNLKWKWKTQECIHAEKTEPVFLLQWSERLPASWNQDFRKTKVMSPTNTLMTPLTPAAQTEFNELGHTQSCRL